MYATIILIIVVIILEIATETKITSSIITSTISSTSTLKAYAIVGEYKACDYCVVIIIITTEYLLST